MTASSRGAYAALRNLRPMHTSQNPIRSGRVPAIAMAQLCSRCASRFRTPRRAYSTAATAADSPSQSGAEISSASSTATSESSSRQPYRVRAAVIVSRPPLLTRKLTDFENAFFFYQKRLNERLTQPFMTSVYFKPDTGALLDWNLKVRERGGAVGKELGGYRPRGGMAWDDELKVGDTLSAEESVRRLLLKDGEARVSDDIEEILPEDRVPLEEPQPRETDADRAGDVTRLDRRLDRTLYLVLRKGEVWEFPNAIVATDSNLHDVMDEAAGVNMNTWVVGRAPVAHHVQHPVVRADGSTQRRGDKTFFLKARIMAGQADLVGNPHGYEEFRWLAREELADVLAPEYYHSVKNMMADR